MTEIIIVLFAAVSGLFFAYRKGKGDASQEREIEDHNEYIATKKRIDDALAGGGDVADLRERMRNRDADQR